jgi:hypothetical protein
MDFEALHGRASMVLCLVPAMLWIMSTPQEEL